MKLRFEFGLQALLLIGLFMITSVSCDDDDGTGVDEGPTIALELITDGLASPLVVQESTDNSGRLFVVDQGGQIYIIKDGSRVSTPFLDISGKVVPRASAQDERGLLGLAFHPSSPAMAASLSTTVARCSRVVKLDLITPIISLNTMRRVAPT